MIKKRSKLCQEYTKKILRKIVFVAFEQSSKKKASYCRDIGIPESTFEKWLNQFGVPKEKDNESSEVRKLKQEIFDLTMERDIFKKSIAIFARTKK